MYKEITKLMMTMNHIMNKHTVYAMHEYLSNNTLVLHEVEYLYDYMLTVYIVSQQELYILKAFPQFQINNNITS